MTTVIHDQVFADGITEIGYGGGAIRLDFFTLGLPAAEGQAPQRIANLRVVMTPQGFIEAFAVAQGMIQKMRDAGMIQEAPSAGAAPGAVVKSPNF